MFIWQYMQKTFVHFCTYVYTYIYICIIVPLLYIIIVITCYYCRYYVLHLNQHDYVSSNLTPHVFPLSGISLGPRLSGSRAPLVAQLNRDDLSSRFCGSMYELNIDIPRMFSSSWSTQAMRNKHRQAVPLAEWFPSHEEHDGFPVVYDGGDLP